MSRLFEARKHRAPSEIPRYSSDIPLELANAELYLNGIMKDIDTILEEWKYNSDHGSNAYQISEPMDDRDAKRPNWIQETLGKHFSL